MRAMVNYKQNKPWITDAINRHTKQIINFIVDIRTKKNVNNF
jgi:IS1 family transposase